MKRWIVETPVVLLLVDAPSWWEAREAFVARAFPEWVGQAGAAYNPVIRCTEVTPFNVAPAGAMVLNARP